MRSRRWVGSVHRGLWDRLRTPRTDAHSQPRGPQPSRRPDGLGAEGVLGERPKIRGVAGPLGYGLREGHPFRGPAICPEGPASDNRSRDHTARRGGIHGSHADYEILVVGRVGFESITN